MNQTTTQLDALEINPKTKAEATIIWLHGLGASGHDFLPVAEHIQEHFHLPIRVILPHAPSRPVTINAGTLMPAWFDILSLDPSQPQDAAGIEETNQQIKHLIKQENKAGIATNRIFLAGFSQGGAMALHTSLHYPETLGGVLALSTFLPLHEQFGTKTEAANKNTPIFMAHGSQDPVLPLMFGTFSKGILEQHGYQVDWHEYATMEHSVCPQEIKDIEQWLKSLL